MMLCQCQPLQLIALNAAWVYHYLPAIVGAALTVMHINAVSIYATDHTEVKLKYSVLAATWFVKAELL